MYMAILFSSYNIASRRSLHACCKSALCRAHRICRWCIFSTCTGMSSCTISRCSTCLGMRIRLCSKLLSVCSRDLILRAPSVRTTSSRRPKHSLRWVCQIHRLDSLLTAQSSICRLLSTSRKDVSWYICLVELHHVGSRGRAWKEGEVVDPHKEALGRRLFMRMLQLLRPQKWNLFSPYV